MNLLPDVIFDFDGVLADSAPLIVEVLDGALIQVLGSSLPADELRATIGPPFPVAVADLCSRHGHRPESPEVQEIVRLFRAEYGSRAAAETPMFEGIPQALADLGGFARLSICSSKPRPLVESILAGWQCEGLFAAVEAPEPGSSEPKAVGLLHLLEALDTAPRNAWLIGDTAFDASAAAQVGTGFIAVSWGIDSAETLAASGAAAVAGAPSDLAAILLEAVVLSA
ncbi:MAG: HAD family hydrolase [Actinobacteria bacterium]|nr:HAD family hydrolase [Actinomycetota bacterium]